jgi:Zinc carboxypeptidase
MSNVILVPLVALSACTASNLGGWLEVPPPSYIETSVRSIADKVRTIESFEIGRTRQGRAISVLRIAADGAVSPDEQPALLVVAGLNGDHRVGVDVAMGLAQAIDSEHADLLAKRTVYIVAGVNLDALVSHLDADRPTQSFATTFTPDDADRDGRVDEDGPRDLNGDGVISMMRIENPGPGSDLEATWMLDPDDDRLLVKPDADKGERATHALIVEGMDADGDGKIAEDGEGGVLLDKNFPYRWPEWENGSGRYQLSEPESMALVNWMLSRDNIIAVLTFGPDDTLVKIPDAGKMDATGRMVVGIEKGDKPEYEAISEAFQEATGIKSAPTSDAGGSFRGWAYANFGVLSFSTPVWVRPDQVDKPEVTEEPSADAADAEEGEKDVAAEKPPSQPEDAPKEAKKETKKEPKKNGKKSGKKSDDAKWLAYSDDERDGAGFLDWTAFDHPQLGTVEIGGFVPGFRMNPPQDELADLVAQQTTFIADLLGMFPEVAVDGPVATRLDGNVWRIAMRVRNDGFLPTRSASGVKARRIRPMIVHLEMSDDQVISGRRAVPIETIAGGDSVEIEWTVVAQEGASIKVRIDSPVYGERSLTVTAGGEG